MQGAEHVGRALARLDREVGAGDVADEEASRRSAPPRGRRRDSASRSRKEVCSGRWPGVWIASIVDLAQLQRPAVAERLVRVLGLGQLVDVDRGAGGAREPAVAGDVVGVVVRLQHVLDPHPVQSGEVPVGVDVPLRVDHGGDAGVAVGDQVGGAAEVLVDDLAEEHWAVLSDDGYRSHSG